MLEGGVKESPHSRRRVVTQKRRFYFACVCAEYISFYLFIFCYQHRTRIGRHRRHHCSETDPAVRAFAMASDMTRPIYERIVSTSSGGRPARAPLITVRIAGKPGWQIRQLSRSS